MTTPADLDALARGILDANLYMTLATADAAGRAWASPVYCARAGYAELYWVSQPDTRHSRNLATRPELSIAVFDSNAPIGAGQAVYMSAVAEKVTDAELEAGIAVFSRSSEAHGGRAWTAADVRPPAPLRLYRATVSEHWVLDPGAERDERTPVSP